MSLDEKDLSPTHNSEEIFPEAQDQWLIQTRQLELLDQDYRKEKNRYVWRYQFTAYNPGVIQIPPVSVSLGPQSFSTEAATLTVVTDRADNDGELRPDAGPLSRPWSKWFWIFLIGAPALAALLYRYQNRFRFIKSEPKEPNLPKAPSESPAEWLRKQLLILRARVETGPATFSPALAWSALLREYLDKQTGHPAMAWTSSQLAERLYPDPKSVRIAEMMRECDKAKFQSPQQRPESSEEVQLTLRWIAESERLFL